MRHGKLFCCTAALSVMFTTTAFAEVAVPRVRFLDPQYRQIDPTDRIVIRVRAEDLVGNGRLRVRVFPGDSAELRDRYFSRSADGCLLYNSVVFENVIDAAGFIDFSGQIDANWLRKNGSGRPVDSKYLLVIEREGPTNRWVKIFDRSLDEYFGRGYVFELVAPTVEEKSVLTRVAEAVVDAITPDTAYAADQATGGGARPPTTKSGAGGGGGGGGGGGRPVAENADAPRDRPLRLRPTASSSTRPAEAHSDPVNVRISSESRRSFQIPP